MLAFSCLNIQFFDDLKFGFWECFSSFLDSINIIKINELKSRTESLTLVHGFTAKKAIAKLATIRLAMVGTAPIEHAAIRFAAAIPVAISTIIKRPEVILEPIAQLAISFD